MGLLQPSLAFCKTDLSPLRAPPFAGDSLEQGFPWTRCLDEEPLPRERGVAPVPHVPCRQNQQEQEAPASQILETVLAPPAAGSLWQQAELELVAPAAIVQPLPLDCKPAA